MRLEIAVVLELIGFTVLMLMARGYRLKQVQHLKRQLRYYRKFRALLSEIRRRNDVPEKAHQKLEEMARMSLSPQMVRRVAWDIICSRAPATKHNEMLIEIQEAHGDVRNLLNLATVCFFLALTHGDFIFGTLIRRARFYGLSRESQVDIAAEAATRPLERQRNDHVAA